MPQIMIVDDDRVFAETLARVAAQLGHEATIAESAEAALQHCRRALPDFILLDIRLPDRDGYDLARELQRNPNWQGRIVSMSELPPDAVRQAEAGVYYHVPKSFGLESLRSFLRSL